MSRGKYYRRRNSGGGFGCLGTLFMVALFCGLGNMLVTNPAGLMAILGAIGFVATLGLIAVGFSLIRETTKR